MNKLLVKLNTSNAKRQNTKKSQIQMSNVVCLEKFPTDDADYTTVIHSKSRLLR